LVHCPIGKASFGAEKLAENFNTLVGAINKARPAAAKGQYIKNCVIASTMGPGIKVNTTKLGYFQFGYRKDDSPESSFLLYWF
ncbi:MAG: hypothetical protein IJW81_06650, partial [Clostridia bacterium]|nr:hypothetical protein [Clostridia bacterium]